MGTIQDLQFSWKDHKDFLTKSFKQQRDSEQHCNVSVVSSDGFVVRSHQAVLASASGWFARELLRHCHDHPTIVLHDVPLGHLKAILNYIYFGAVQIEQSMMTELLEIADNLELKGLCRIRKNSAINKFLSVGSAGVVGKAEQDSFVGASSSQTRPLAGGGLARSAAVDGRVSRPSPVFTSQLQYNQEDRHYPHHHHTLLQSHDAACVGGGSGGEPVLFGDPCEDSQPAEENAEEEQLQSSNHAQSSKMSSSSIQHDTENSCGRSALASSQMPGQHHYLGLARLNEPPSVSGSTSTSTLQHQGSFMSCSSMNNGVVHSVSSNNAPSTIDISSSQHSNGLSYVPSSSASCYNQPSTSLSSIFHNRSVAATSCSSSIQQQQQQQHLVQFTSNNLQTTHHPSSQLITTSTTVNPFTTKREFDAKMLTRSVTGPLDYHCANQQLQEQEQQQHHHHSVEDFRAQHSSNKMNQASKVSNEGGSQEIAYLPQDSHVIEQLHQHSVAAAAALNTQQQCLQQQGQQLPQRHLYSQYVHGVGGQVSFVSAAQGCGNSNIISSSSSATGSHLQSMQQQQQQQQQQSHQAQQLQQLHLQHQQQTSSFGFECSLASTGSSVTFKSGSSIGNGGVVGAYQSIPGNQHNSQDEAIVSGGSDGLVLRASTSNSTGYQTAGIDLSLTKSEPPSPRDYTAAAGVFAPTNKRKRAGAAEYNSRREDESDGEEVAGPQHLYEEEKEGVETDLDEVGDRSHHKRNKLTTHHNQRGGAAEGSGGQGPRPASPSLQPEAGGQSTAVDMMTELADDWDCSSPESPSLPRRCVEASVRADIARDSRSGKVKHSEEDVADPESDPLPRSRHLGYSNEDENHQRAAQMITSLPVTSSLSTSRVGQQASSINYTVSSNNYNVRGNADENLEVEEEDDSSKKRILEVDEISISKEELSSSSTPSSLVSFSPALGCRVSEFPPGTVFPSSRLIRDVVSRLSRGKDLVTNVAVNDGRRRSEMATSTDGLTDIVRCSEDAKVEETASTDQEGQMDEDEKGELVLDEAYISIGSSFVKGVVSNQQVVYAPSRVLEDEDFISSGCSLPSGRAVSNDQQEGRTPLRRSSVNVEVSSTTREYADSSLSGSSTAAAEDSQSQWQNQNLSNFVCMKKMRSMRISRPATANLKSAPTAALSSIGITTSQTSLKEQPMDDKSKGFGCNNSSSDIIFLSCGIVNKDFTNIHNSRHSNEVERPGTADGVSTIACLSEREETSSKASRSSSFIQSCRASNNLTGASSLVDADVDDGIKRPKQQLPGHSSPAAHTVAATQATITGRQQKKKTTRVACGNDATKLSLRTSSGDVTVTPSAELVPTTPAAMDNEDVLNKVYRRFVLVNYVSSQSDRGSSSSPRIITTSTSLSADHPSGSQGQCTTLSPSDVAHMYITEADRKITPPRKEVKRPLNMYMLYSQSVRAAVAAQFANEPCIKISARIAAMWRQLTGEQRAVWAARANEAREEHKRRFPGYRYNSQTRRLRKLEYQHARERKRAMFRVLPAPAHI